MKRVCVDVPRWSFYRKDTDFLLKNFFVANFATDGTCYPRFPWLYDLIYNMRYLLTRFLPVKLRLPIDIFMALIRSMYCNICGERVVISQGQCPVVLKRGYTIWETFFLPPQMGEIGRGEFRRGGNDRWIKSLERYGASVNCIGVRGRASVELLKSMYPEFAAKVRDLPYVQPECRVIDEEGIVSKNESSLVEILFIGRAAKRKGLDILIDAVEDIRASGVENFTLTIVSDMTDGPVVVPHKDYIRFRESVSHDEALMLFRRSHIFVMPSRFESYGLVYHEALANGCVTFVRDAEPQREFVNYGNAGECIAINDSKDLQKKLIPYLYSKELRIKVAKAGRMHYIQNFSHPVCVKKWEALFAGIPKELMQ